MQRKNWFKLTIIFHRDSEHFNMIVMSFKKTLAYVQRKIDQLFRVHDFFKFTRVYVNDVIIFSKTLKKYLKHLVTVFALFFRLRIALKSFKAYIDYSSITLLEQYVTALRFTIATKKLKVIFKLRFSHTLKKLKHYLKLIDWFRDYVKRYVQKTELLKQRKTVLLRQSFNNKSNQRKAFSQRTLIEQISSPEIVAYETLQLTFNKSTFLVHFDRNRILFIDVNSFKKHNFGIVIYYAKNEAKYRIDSKILIIRTNIKLILFFSKCLTNVESRY